ncbi:hypothetical protein Bca4012_043201 [Brassica carinata]
MQSTTVYGFESDEYIFEMNGHVSLKYDTDCALLQSVQDKFFIEMNGHVSFKDDTEGVVLNHDVSKCSEPWGNWLKRIQRVLQSEMEGLVEKTAAGIIKAVSQNLRETDIASPPPRKPHNPNLSTP